MNDSNFKKLPQCFKELIKFNEDIKNKQISNLFSDKTLEKLFITIFSNIEHHMSFDLFKIMIKREFLKNKKEIIILNNKIITYKIKRSQGAFCYHYSIFFTVKNGV